MHLLDITQVEREIEALLAEYPELSEDETLRADMLEGETDAYALLGRIVNRIREAETMEAAIAQRVADLEARKSREAARNQAMRSLAFRIMRAAKLPKAVLPEATLSIRVTPPKVDIADLTMLIEQAPHLTRTRIEPDKTAIKEALQAGAEVPGARLSNGVETLSVRTR